jgi:VIT1/CCC1 family predicted Fe2+/Mn2+ transporter
MKIKVQRSIFRFFKGIGDDFKSASDDIRLNLSGTVEAIDLSKDSFTSDLSDIQDEFDQKLTAMSQAIDQFLNEDLKKALKNLATELQKIRKNASHKDLNLGIKVIDTVMRAESVTHLSAQDESDNENSSSDSLLERLLKPSLELENLAEELETKGNKWGKIAGVLLILSGIALSIASFLTMIPSFGVTSIGIAAGVTWTLAGLSLICGFAGAGLRWGFGDTPTDLSRSVETVARLI